MAECSNNGYALTEILNIAFFIEMPNSWSNKKKNDYAYKKHQQKPDRDNLLKAFQDAFGADDSFVYDGRTSKYWSYVPMIIVY
jgi:Holliday junction resolvase RusA-like endonuclease